MHQEFNWKSQNPITRRLCEGSFIVLRDMWLRITLSMLILNFSLLFLALLGFNILPGRIPCFCIKHFPHCLVAVRQKKLVSLACTVQKHPHYTNMHLLWASITACRYRFIQKDAEIYIYPTALGLLAKYFNVFLCIFRYVHIFKFSQARS